MISILIVDDSEVAITILKGIFAREKDIQIIGYAKNGKEALEKTKRYKPDLITMDLHMPIMDGIEAIQLIMSQYPTPIIAISSKLNDENLNGTFRALDAGALSVIEKPLDVMSPNFASVSQRIVDTVRTMSKIHVIKRRFRITKEPEMAPKIRIEASEIRHYEMVAIGTSVGGPQALKTILTKLPKHFPVPIVIVQHMSPGFIAGFANWLNEITPLTVKQAEDNEIFRPGNVYFAPDNFHLEMTRRNYQLLAKLVKAPPVAGFCPSATVLLQSVAKVCGANAVGILLTGMGSDGAHGLLELKQANGHTLIQDAKSAVVFGMAGVAQSLGAVDRVIDLDKMSDYLIKIVS